MSVYESSVPLLAEQGIRYLTCLVKQGHQAAALDEFEHTQQGRHVMKAASGSVTSSDVIASMILSLASVLVGLTVLGRMRGLDTEPYISMMRPSVTPTAVFRAAGQPIPMTRISLAPNQMPNGSIATMVGITKEKSWDT